MQKNALQYSYFNIIEIQSCFNLCFIVVYWNNLSMSKNSHKSPPKINLVRGSIRNPGFKASMICQSPTEFSKPTIQSNACYYVSTKGNIQVPGRTAVSPKGMENGYRRFRSPSCIEEQNQAFLKQ